MSEMKLDLGTDGRILMGHSIHIELLRNEILILASQDCPVLIAGETGTGKELVARGLHHSGKRNGKSFLPVNCNMFLGDPGLLRSELFGHAKGAFTGADQEKIGILEEAGHGTVFLDEIGDIPPGIQGQLLRASENSEILRVGETKTIEINCRILAATNKDVRGSEFRKDLYFRFPEVIEIPPLRQRKLDLVFLIVLYLKALFKNAGIKPARVPLQFLVMCLEHQWEGNHREFLNKIGRIVRRFRPDMTPDQWCFAFDQHWYERPKDTVKRFFGSHWLRLAEEFGLKLEPDLWLKYSWVQLSALETLERSCRSDPFKQLFFEGELNRFLAEQLRKTEREIRTEVPGLNEYQSIPSRQLKEFVGHVGSEQPLQGEGAKLGAGPGHDHPDQASVSKSSEGQSFTADYRDSLDEVKVRFVREVFKRQGRNQVKAAESLGINRATVGNMLKRNGARASKAKK